MGALQRKQISATGIAQSLEKAERYRLLHEPSQAESICRDILEADRANQHALRALVLALTDQLGTNNGRGKALEVRDAIGQFADPFDRTYYMGVVYERESRALLERPTAVRSAAYDGFRQAMECYERAEALRPGHVDAILRWNSCTRAIESERLEPAEPQRELPLE
ncbi:MAG TPA: hypothetical protein VM513_12360 [Kofleriaceae bacterium]|jgi:hypothetical protein|nr:hypothetical protein [Kofleriaceae bacterium]